MKISYRTHPILEKLNNGKLGVLPFFECDKLFIETFVEKVTKNWKFYHTFFKQEVNIISEAFTDAAFKAMPKLLGLYEDIIKNDLSDFFVAGTFCFKDHVAMFYHDIKQGSEDVEISYYLFTKDGIPVCFYNDSAKYKIFQNGWVTNAKCINPNDKEKIEHFIHNGMAVVTLFYMFKKYAEVETKIIEPNSVKREPKQKYVNDTKLQLTYLDSKWFTNLVKSDAFKVSGHFRLQPCKNKIGQWTKKLIWISDFMKTGYTAPARKESVNCI